MDAIEPVVDYVTGANNKYTFTGDRPWVTNDVAVLNGRTALASTAMRIKTKAAVLPMNSVGTTFAVAQYLTSTKSGKFIGDWSDAYYDMRWYWAVSGNKMNWHPNGTSTVNGRINGVPDGTVTQDPFVFATPNNIARVENSARALSFGGGAAMAWGEVLNFSRVLSESEIAFVEAGLMDKWGIKSASILPTGAEVSVSSGATLDLGSYVDVTVAALNLQDGAVISVSTLPADGAVVLKASEMTVGQIVVKVGGKILAGAGASVFSDTEGFKCLKIQRVPSVYTYVGESGSVALFTDASNFRVNGVVTDVVPNVEDTIRIASPVSINLDQGLVLGPIVLDADLTLSGTSAGYVLQTGDISGEGRLILNGDAVLAATKANAKISAPLMVAKDTTNRIHISRYDYYYNLAGNLSGAGTLRFTYYKNENYGGNVISCDCSAFEGTIIEVPPSSANARRNCTQFKGDVDLRKASVVFDASHYGGSAKLQFAASNKNTVMRFGSLQGTVGGSASGSLIDHFTIEVGYLGKDDTVTGDWMVGQAARTPALRKVGTGTFTTSAKDAYKYILNGGTLVLKDDGAVAAQGEPVTELAGRSVIGVTNTVNGVTVRTYTLNSAVRPGADNAIELAAKTAEAAAEEAKAIVVTLDEGRVEAGQTADYFKVVVREDAGVFKAFVELDEAKVTPVGVSMSFTENNEVSVVPGNVKKGLYYKLANSAIFEGAFAGGTYQRASADNESLTLSNDTLPENGDKVMFYRIVVSDTAE